MYGALVANAVCDMRVPSVWECVGSSRLMLCMI